MALIKRRRSFDTNIEKDIITGMIVSTAFLRELSLFLDHKFFSSPHSKIIADWAMTYFRRYNEAPLTYIQDIFSVEKESLSDVDREMVAKLLEDISNKYSEQQSPTFNHEFYLDKTKDYFRERSLQLTAGNITSYLDAGQPDKAEEALRGHREVARVLAPWIDPFARETTKRILQKEFQENPDEEKENFLFRFPGALGKMMGDFERNWLVAFMGPMKRGKSWMLQEVAVHALLSNLNVTFFTLEMTAEQVAARMFKRLSALSSVEDDCVYPCFDCFKNQIGACSRRERINKIKLLDDIMEKPQWKKSMPYRPCTHCRSKDYLEFEPATWFEYISRKKFSTHAVLRTVNTFYISSIGGSRLRIISRPAYSATTSDMKNDLRQLEDLEGFVSDVVVDDYADLRAPEKDSARLDARARIDETWKMEKNTASEKHCLVATASQSVRATLDKKSVKASDMAEDIRKVAHVDGLWTLNQTPIEKRNGILRIGTAVHRHRAFDELQQVLVLQNLKMGQPFLDSEFYKARSTT